MHENQNYSPTNLTEIHVLRTKCYDRQHVARDRSLLSSQHVVKVSSKAEADSEHDVFAFGKKKKLLLSLYALVFFFFFFFTGLSPVIKFHITEVFRLTLLNETTIRAKRGRVSEIYYAK